ncbi:hypothetical protein F4780DRAFT_722154 [Xylariomycetidae sp. FL0641]|nr:hypothetical protein F4780DRAFT_722154 [Xylariomycetidae sp. FL0641]
MDGCMDTTKRGGAVGALVYLTYLGTTYFHRLYVGSPARTHLHTCCCCCIVYIHLYRAVFSLSHHRLESVRRTRISTARHVYRLRYAAWLGVWLDGRTDGRTDALPV